MTRDLKLAALAGSALAALSNPAPALAQPEMQADAGDIVVTARRVEERLQDVPISISVFTQEAIASRNIFNAADLGTYTPSLSTNSRFGPEKASFAIRGFVQDLDTAPSVGVYFAEVVGPRSGAATPSGNGVGVGNLFDLQSVQVLKGPQGTLFGRNTTGGAVLLLPQKPTDRLEGYVEASMGSYDMKRGQAVINLPLADTFRVRLGVDRMKRDGYLKNHSGIGPKRLADTDFIAARLSIVADLTLVLENYTIATFSESDNNGSIPRLVDCFVPGPNNIPAGFQGIGSAFACGQIARQNARGDGWWEVENSEPDPRQLTRTWQVINTATWRASDSLTVKSITSYAELRERSRFSLEGENFLIPQMNVPFLTVIRIGNTPGYDTASQSTFTQELQLVGSAAGGRLDWQAGGYFENSDPIGYMGQMSPFMMNCSDYQSLKCAPSLAVVPVGQQLIYVSNISQPWQKRWYRSRGLYAQGTYALTRKLNLTGGLRHTWDRYSHYYASTAIGFSAPNQPVAFCNNPIANPGPNPAGGLPIKFITPGDFRQCDFKVSGKSNRPTWLLSLDYKANDDLMVYAKYARGYRSGGVNAAYSGYTGWGPEKVDAYEVGVKAGFAGAVRGYVNVAAFYNDFSDQQIQATLNAKANSPVLGGTAIVNAGKSRIWGIEADASVTLFDALRLEAGYTYLNTRLKSLTGIPAPDLTPWVPGTVPWGRVIPTSVPGGPLALSPKNRFTLTGTWTLPIDESIGRISVGATFVHTDKQIASRATLPKWGIMPATNLLNLNASWNGIGGTPVDLSFFMTNATNRKFPVNVANAWNSFGLESQLVNEPRMWGLRLKYRFGE